MIYYLKVITHIVLFKLIDRSPAAIERARNVLSGMEGKISQLRHLEVGTDVIHSERSYDIALIAKFDSLEDLQAYQIHPLHVTVSDYMKSVKESSIAVDFES